MEASGGIGRGGWRTLNGGQWRDWQRGGRTLGGQWRTGQWRDWREVETLNGGQWRPLGGGVEDTDGWRASGGIGR
ncbi:unnamed protein product [Staurois parvus]|uniref:Uncharacterized protein n=2 Tax=Staurois parvus TaxID=386267 RepID=A0ABN9AYT5_9NEOB|nr:unnamed protein product [Staurois parvus]